MLQALWMGLLQYLAHCIYNLPAMESDGRVSIVISIVAILVSEYNGDLKLYIR